MSALNPLDVIVIHDGCIKPPGPKMVVCIEPELGLFFRINTKDKWQTPVKLSKVDNSFLDHDSYLECGDPLELDDYVIDEALRHRPIIGTITRTIIPQILEAVSSSRTLSANDKASIKAALR